MIYRLLFIALLISVLPSCTHEFSLTEVDAESKIVLFCMPSTLGDTTLIQVARSRVIHNQGTNTDSTSSCCWLTMRLRNIPYR